MNDRTIAKLIESIGRGRDPKALADLFDLTAQDLYRLALRLTGNATDAEDSLQETFLAVMRGASTFDAAMPAGPWLTTVLAHAVDRLRSRRGVAPLDHEHEPRARESMSADQREDWTRARAAIDRLPERYRRILILRFEHGLATPEIAAMLRVPDSTVRSLLGRGIARLRRKLGVSSLVLLPASSVETARVLRRVRRRLLPEVGVATTSVVGGLFVITQKTVIAVAGAVTALLVVAAFLVSAHDRRGEFKRLNSTGLMVASSVPQTLDANADSTPLNSGGADPSTAVAVEPASARRIGGRVIDESGAAIAGARVYLVRSTVLAIAIRDAKWTTTTDATGEFRIADPPGGVIDLGVAAEELAPALVLDVEIPDGPCDLRRDVIVSRGLALVGRVVDVVGRPVAGATVCGGEGRHCGFGREGFEALLLGRSRIRRPAHWTTTDGDGAFRLGGFPSDDPVPITCIKDGFCPFPDLSCRDDAVPAQETTLVLAPLEPVRVVVVDDETGAPVPRFAVTMKLASTLSTQLHPHDYSVDFMGDSDETGARTVRLPALARPMFVGALCDGPAGRRLDDVWSDPIVLTPDLREPLTVVIRIRALDRATEHPPTCWLEPVVDVLEPPGRTLSDKIHLFFLCEDLDGLPFECSASRGSDGRFAIDAYLELPPGRYRVVALDFEWMDLLTQPRIGDDVESFLRSRFGAWPAGVLDVEESGSPNLRLAFESLGALAVKATDDGGRAIEEVPVSVVGDPDVRWWVSWTSVVADLGMRSHCNAVGGSVPSYAVTLPPGRYTLTFARKGFAFRTEVVEVIGGEVTHLEVKLSKS
ncbi:MAG: sigma-70 family RNA polymerase sigma factor [Planctomycetes bacterium]|nr:sigma-70 family RNA polymerase sigma factor [Planctomycetota bacterium]